MYSRLDIQKIIVKQLQRMSDIMVSCFWMEGTDADCVNNSPQKMRQLIVLLYVW